MAYKFREIIEAFGGVAEFARAIDAPEQVVQMMRYRDNIAVARWQDVVEAAKKRGDGFEFITFPYLFRALEDRRKLGRLTKPPREEKPIKKPKLKRKPVPSQPAIAPQTNQELIISRLEALIEEIKSL